MKHVTIGVLAFHGDVDEHIKATEKAAKNLRSNPRGSKLNIEVIPIRSQSELQNLDALIIPGGESTTLYKLCEREGMFEQMKKIKNIFGTCAGAIMLAKIVDHKTPDQKTLELMDIRIDRNAYGKQTDSFEQKIDTKLGPVNAVFIRAPKIKKVGSNIKVLAKENKEILACEEKAKNCYYLATCFHPELTTTIFHEYFLKQI